MSRKWAGLFCMCLRIAYQPASPKKATHIRSLVREQFPTMPSVVSRVQSIRGRKGVALATGHSADCLVVHVSGPIHSLTYAERWIHFTA